MPPLYDTRCLVELRVFLRSMRAYVDEATLIEAIRHDMDLAARHLSS
jgi:hypothetical protein